MKDDQYTLETILSPIYVDISSPARSRPATSWLRRMYEKGAQAVTMKQRVVTCALFGCRGRERNLRRAHQAERIVREKRGVFHTRLSACAGVMGRACIRSGQR